MIVVTYYKQTLWHLFHYLLWQGATTEHAGADVSYEYYEQPPHPTPTNADQASATHLSKRPPTRRPRPGPRLPSPLSPAHVHECDAFWYCEWRGWRKRWGCDHQFFFVHTPFSSSEVLRCLLRTSRSFPLSVVFHTTKEHNNAELAASPESVCTTAVEHNSK
ncbi:hypothetical protein DFJ58DRAFT_774449 [Suillus subalutaceus]|uniref:uncharacterized protein n=1 Tax=Suillus subalutaceus TaxID=48586 RepID=UPI001B865892|nr:uncharacterized protein DFJ58DRAFT_774449 [Suillus subalutaceus]KAG1863218.1 hypothetical protein DFJ58DRAFT_774449 [Suillus subalutaceus]